MVDDPTKLFKKPHHMLHGLVCFELRLATNQTIVDADPLVSKCCHDHIHNLGKGAWSGRETERDDGLKMHTEDCKPAKWECEGRPWLDPMKQGTLPLTA